MVDDIIRRLLDYKKNKASKQVPLMETEIRQLCAAAREILLRQPILLELEAPIKICGTISLSLNRFMLRNTGVVIGLGFFLWMIQMEMLPQARKMMDLYSINMLSPIKIIKKKDCS